MLLLSTFTKLCSSGEALVELAFGSLQGGQMSTNTRQKKQQDLAAIGEHDHPLQHQVVLWLSWMVKKLLKVLFGCVFLVSDLFFYYFFSLFRNKVS